MEEESFEDKKLIDLEEELLKQVIIRTSPRDTCRCSLVSHSLCHVAQSDPVWDHFLPSDLPYILDHPLEHSSKKELFLRLSDSTNPVFIDVNRTIFRLDRSTGAKCYLLSSRRMQFEHGDNPICWKWIRHPASKFDEVAQLLEVWWLEIRASIDSSKLSPNMKYSAYLLFKLESNSVGLKSSNNMETSITIEKEDSETEKLLANVQLIKNGLVRRDGWLEIEIAEFFNAEGTDICVTFKLRDKITTYKKVGLLVEGMEIRPKYT